MEAAGSNPVRTALLEGPGNGGYPGPFSCSAPRAPPPPAPRPPGGPVAPPGQEPGGPWNRP
ncbi:hypothetical protein DQ392_03125 [Streptomyces reniochalinae]|uniref:Uncharacterized protein n=1 Tax=Streptomyces reniochalinae TaxID=2250578 RepID=A0A367F2P6_9ACTN|nr:hypothetical protein DQ392_03125 [Streptomyces reniochalinae]